MSESNKRDPKFKTVKVKSLEQLLGAGYVPEGGDLRTPKGALLKENQITVYAGKVQTGARPTEATDYPVTIDGKPWPKEALIAEVGYDEELGMSVFADGTLADKSGKQTHTTEHAARLAALIDLASKAESRSSK